MVSAIPVSQLHSRTGSSASLFDQSSPENIRSVGTFQPSPVQSPGDTTPWPVLDVAIQAQSSTTGAPVFTIRGRTNSRNPYSKEKGKGRAPDGQRYCCPEPGCTHSPFKNAGNYLIHMWRWHPEYPQRDPAFALRCIPSDEVDETIPNDNSAVLDDICEPSVAPDEGLSFGLFQETLQRPGRRYPPRRGNRRCTFAAKGLAERAVPVVLSKSMGCYRGEHHIDSKRRDVRMLDGRRRGWWLSE
jgi:hypothetical protein